MTSALRPVLVLLAFFTLLTGAAYPALVTGVAHLAFPVQAQGSVITVGGQQRGSRLIGQTFDKPAYFWGRLSATTPGPYNASNSGGANLGPTNPALADEIKARVQALHDADPDNQAAIPVDLVTSSASGLDPDITPAAARYQAHRVATIRGLPQAEVDALITRHITPRQWGLFGEPRVNVLMLNLAIDAAAPATAH